MLNPHTMKELQLSELAPYIAYDLKFWHYDEEREIRSICSFATLTSEEIVIADNMHEYAYLIGDYRVKPILRPMSDLTRKELEAAGFECHIDWLTIEFERWVVRYGNEATISKTPFGHVQYLCKHHFDFKDLIGQGKAISVHTINK
jgi:hypothetical protein